MANYKNILSHVKTNEGGYSADPRDNQSKNPSDVKGLDKRYPTLPVHTYRGVAYASWKEYARRKGFAPTGKSFVNMTLAQWEDFLKTLYWDAIYGDFIKSQGIAEILFESIWGGGSKNLVIDLQTFLRKKGFNIAVDGAMGKQTYTAINEFTAKSNKNETELVKYLTAERLKYLQSLSDWSNYSKGWTRRLYEIQDAGLKYITENPVKTGGAAVGLLLLGAGAYFLSKGGFTKIVG
jgi:lysozyme family protein